MSVCRVCGKKTLPDEEGICYKLLGRGIEEFCCIDCLAAYMHISPDSVRKMIERFRAQGCQLFAPAKKNT